MIAFKYFLLVCIWFVCAAKVTVNGKDVTEQHGRFKFIFAMLIGSLIILL